jgi:hypothetical protein
MPHRSPIRHPNPFRPAQDELDSLRSGASTKPRWQSVLSVILLVLLGVLIVALHLFGIVGIGLHAAGG